MKLTIVTINYNNVEGLKRTIDSVTSQTYQDFEWVVIDGASTDGSVDIIKSHERNIAYWCSETDHGIYNAMNKGISHAQGDYLLFLNSGDSFCQKDSLAKLFKHKISADLCVANCIIMLNPTFRDLSHVGCQRLTMKDVVYGGFPHQSTLMKRTLFLNEKYDETFKIVSDHEFFVKAVLYRDATISFYHDVDLSYFDGTGVSSTNTTLRRTEFQIFKERLLSKLEYDYLQEWKESIFYKLNSAYIVFMIFYGVSRLITPKVIKYEELKCKSKFYCKEVNYYQQIETIRAHRVLYRLLIKCGVFFANRTKQKRQKAQDKCNQSLFIPIYKNWRDS